MPSRYTFHQISISELSTSLFFSPDLELFRRGLLQLDQLSAHQSPSQNRALQQCFMSCSLPDKGGSSLEPVLLLDLLYRHWMARECWTGWQMCHCSHTAMAAAALQVQTLLLGSCTRSGLTLSLSFAQKRLIKLNSTFPTQCFTACQAFVQLCLKNS